MSVINDLYNGKIYPFEEIVSRHKDYQKINEKISEIRKYFTDKMSSEDIKNFTKLEELIHEANSMDTYENFSYGLRLEELQKLTDDKLYFNEETRLIRYDRVIEMTKPKGTSLIRELIDSNVLVEFVQRTDGRSEAEPIRKNDGTNALEKVIVYLKTEGNIQPISKDYYTGKIVEPECPRYIVLGHELVHAYRRINNIPFVSIKGSYNTYAANGDAGMGYRPIEKKAMIEELETTGINYIHSKTGKYVEAAYLRYTENALRLEHRIGPRLYY